MKWNVKWNQLFWLVLEQPQMSPIFKRTCSSSFGVHKLLKDEEWVWYDSPSLCRIHRALITVARKTLPFCRWRFHLYLRRPLIHWPWQMRRQMQLRAPCQRSTGRHHGIQLMGWRFKGVRFFLSIPVDFFGFTLFFAFDGVDSAAWRSSWISPPAQLKSSWSPSGNEKSTRLFQNPKDIQPKYNLCCNCWLKQGDFVGSASLGLSSSFCNSLSLSPSYL